MRKNGAIIAVESNGLAVGRGHAAVESKRMHLVSKAKADKRLVVVHLTLAPNIVEKATNAAVGVVACLGVRAASHSAGAA